MTPFALPPVPLHAPNARSPIAAVLFDLDGTLIDSAPDLGAAANRMRTRRGLGAWPLHRYRNMAGAGARGMLGVAFGIAPSMPGYANLREEFFQCYESDLHGLTHAFDGVSNLLAALQKRGTPWGIVTNKSERFSHPLRAHMPVLQHCAVIVSGDTTPHAKPHPEPVLEACRRLKLAPPSVLYVGDDERDIAAGRAAGCATAACTWGYLGQNPDVTSWHADHIVATPLAVLGCLRD